MKKEAPELIHGTLDLLILKTIANSPMHGWAIAKHIQQISDKALEVGQGSLYPALYRLEERDLIRGAWGKSETGRRAKVYSLTHRGRKQLVAEEALWENFYTAINRVLHSS